MGNLLLVAIGEEEEVGARLAAERASAHEIGVLVAVVLEADGALAKCRLVVGLVAVDASWIFHDPPRFPRDGAVNG
jgi:hypothetical protein